MIAWLLRMVVVALVTTSVSLSAGGCGDEPVDAAAYPQHMTLVLQAGQCCPTEAADAVEADAPSRHCAAARGVTASAPVTPQVGLTVVTHQFTVSGTFSMSPGSGLGSVGAVACSLAQLQVWRR